MNFDARLPVDFPFLAGQPVWLFVVLLLIGMIAVGTLNSLYFAWLHRRAPRLLRLRVILAIFALCIGVIAIGLVVNPPSEVRKAMQRAQPK
jgi:hypothetical protein